MQTRGGAAWNADDVIVFARTRRLLARIRAGRSGVPGDDHEAKAAISGRSFWETAAISSTPPPLAGSIYLGSLRQRGRRAILMKFPVRISSLAYVPGYIFFVQDATLFARPFDEKRLEFTGEPIRIVDGIPVMGPGRAAFSVSAAGVLAYWPYPVGSRGRAAVVRAGRPRIGRRGHAGAVTSASRSPPTPASWRFPAPARMAAQTCGYGTSRMATKTD